MPVARDGRSTQANSINLIGQITGYYFAVDGIYHGFVRERK
jgi:hypothetical protein